jgi:hypothetical protein
MPRIANGTRLIHRLGTPTAKQLAARAEEIEAQIGDTSNTDDPRWLRRIANTLRGAAAKKEKASATKKMQRRNRRQK